MIGPAPAGRPWAAAGSEIRPHVSLTVQRPGSISGEPRLTQPEDGLATVVGAVICHMVQYIAEAPLDRLLR